MGPTIAFGHPDGEISGEDTAVRIVVAGRGDAAEKIFESPAAETCCQRNAEMLPDGRKIGMVDISGPIPCIRIGPMTQPGEQVELEVIVGVNEPRQDQAAADVQTPRVGRYAYGGSNGGDRPRADFEVQQL
jgi:hypothetical protein